MKIRMLFAIEVDNEAVTSPLTYESKKPPTTRVYRADEDQLALPFPKPKQLELGSPE